MLTGADHSPKCVDWNDGTVEGSNCSASVGPESRHPARIAAVTVAAAVKRSNAVIEASVRREAHRRAACIGGRTHMERTARVTLRAPRCYGCPATRTGTLLFV